MTGFVSTRGGATVSLADALFSGLAPDGGLYVPVEMPSLPPLAAPVEDIASAGRWLAPSMLPDAEPELIERVVSEAFTFPAPLREVEPRLHVLELFHGPTHAFKDIGARFMARLMSALDRGGPTRTVLVATSGDTGSAVAHAFHGLAGYRVIVLFPHGGVSARQRRQMTTLGGNVSAFAVEGTFDDCQRMAKEAFQDVGFRERYHLTSANSINIGRLIPQSLYYAYAAAKVGWSDRPVRFVVPSGNLGNLCGGLLAQLAGMPTAGFVSAVNANRAFVDYLAEGQVEPRPSIPTHSSAMDVGVPSNLERIRWLYGSTPERLRREVRGVSVSDEQTRACIADTYERSGYVVDPHTAVGFCAHGLCPPIGDEATVVISTAHPAKFPEVVEEATGTPVPLPPGIAAVMDKDEEMTHIEASLDALREALKLL